MKRKTDNRIGIIGGVGPQATSVLYSEIMKFAQKKYGASENDDYPHIIIESIPIPDFISDKENIDEALLMLKKVVINLENTGCKRLCIASNTVHLLIDDLKRSNNVDFTSMINMVAKRCRDLNMKKVGIVASNVTIESKLYEKALEKFDIEIIKPDKNQRMVIDKIIRYVLAGEDNGRERKAYIQILNDLMDNGAEGIILGCTELPLAINYEALGNKVINSMKVLAETIVDYYYKNNI